MTRAGRFRWSGRPYGDEGIFAGVAPLRTGDGASVCRVQHGTGTASVFTRLWPANAVFSAERTAGPGRCRWKTSCMSERSTSARTDSDSRGSLPPWRSVSVTGGSQPASLDTVDEAIPVVTTSTLAAARRVERRHDVSAPRGAGAETRRDRRGGGVRARRTHRSPDHEFSTAGSGWTPVGGTRDGTPPGSVSSERYRRGTANVYVASYRFSDR